MITSAPGLRSWLSTMPKRLSVRAWTIVPASVAGEVAPANGQGV